MIAVTSPSATPGGSRNGSMPSSADNRILKRLMWPLTATLLLFLVLVAALLWHHQEQRLQDIAAQRVAEIPNRLQAIQTQQLAVMSVLLEHITADNALREALRAHDREGLLAGNRELLEILRQKYGISHFYFQDKDRNNILRVQFPEKIGGRIDRYTTLEAERTGKVVGGLELGSYGILSLRVVQPVFSGGELIGYVELGKEIDDILQELHQAPDVEVAVTIHKKVLERKKWETGMRLIHREFGWDDLPRDVVAYTSLPSMPTRFLEMHLAEDDPRPLNQEAKIDGISWRMTALPIKDASGRGIGHLFVMMDISAQKAAFLQTMITASAVATVVLTLLMFFLFGLLRKTDAFLLAQQEKLIQAEARQQAVFDSVLDAIIMIDERGRIELVNPAFQDIFGYRAEEVLGRNVSMLMPDPDRSAHDGYMQHYLSSGESKIIGIGREVVGQRKDGSIFPMDLAISETHIEGRRLFTGLVRDITTRKQVEADLVNSLQLQHEYQNHAIVDVLTGLHNRRWLDDVFARQLARCTEEGHDLSLIMVDADHFKSYNDTQGHLGGDCALRALGAVIIDNIRPNDLAARYGGEEFAILLPNTSLAKAVTMAERLRIEVEKMPITAPDNRSLPSITVSLGLAEMQKGDTLATLIASADAALYRAKQKGRNRVSA